MIEALGGLAAMDPADQLFFGDDGRAGAPGGSRLHRKRRRAQCGDAAVARKRCRGGGVPPIFSEHGRGEYVAEEKDLHACASHAAALARAAGRLGVPRVPLVVQDTSGWGAWVRNAGAFLLSRVRCQG